MYGMTYIKIIIVILKCAIPNISSRWWSLKDNLAMDADVNDDVSRYVNMLILMLNWFSGATLDD